MAITVARMGGSISNYTEVTNLLKEEGPDGKQVINGARIKDRLSGK